MSDLTNENTSLRTYNIVSRFFTEVLEKAKDAVPEVPDYRLSPDYSVPYIKKQQGIFKFLVASTEGVLPEGKTDRPTDWVGFGNISERIFRGFSKKEQNLILAEVEK